MYDRRGDLLQIKSEQSQCMPCTLCTCSVYVVDGVSGGLVALWMAGAPKLKQFSNIWLTRFAVGVGDIVSVSADHYCPCTASMQK